MVHLDSSLGARVLHFCLFAAILSGVASSGCLRLAVLVCVVCVSAGSVVYVCGVRVVVCVCV